jgi:hypothetical protein
MTPLTLITACGMDFGAIASEINEASVFFDLIVSNADGKNTTFKLLVREEQLRLIVREVEPKFLPVFCPERHINIDSSFCLGWSEKGQTSVANQEDAKHWWEMVLQFLRHQLRTNRLRRWPGPEWAHGNAALHQHCAEEMCHSLGSKFTSLLQRKALVVTQTKSPDGQKLLRLVVDGEHCLSVWAGSERATNSRLPCLCTKGSIKRHRRLRLCGTHCTDIAQLTIALYRWKIEEDNFWKTTKGHKCCGMKIDCPLDH